MATLDIRFDRHLKVYYEGDTVKGEIIVKTKSPLPHQGISVSVEGVASLTLSAKSVGRLEALYNSVKPVTLFSYASDVAGPGKITDEETRIPFGFVLKPRGNNKLYETYHGVFISVQYVVKCLMKRPLLNKDLTKDAEFLVENKNGERATAKITSFSINPNSVQNVNSKTNLPRFSIRGKLDSNYCCITRPFTGEIIVESADTPIRSIELQLMRVETVGCAEGYAKEEIQNIEIGIGNVCRGLAIPIYMVFPRLFSCPTLESTNFKIEFEVNIVVIFQDDRLIMENFPLRLTRN
ncbi:vacuolar protein sorting-associated protein 26C-like isoform X2 [Clavelina lepadiformis]|uniref:vacuolar protein sorting-associated protein 26C-like isoform X2 n=1 Tax=Clavelina lepadiformis TaxID=159417 RepID=UPI004041E3C5